MYNQDHKSIALVIQDPDTDARRLIALLLPPISVFSAALGLIPILWYPEQLIPCFVVVLILLAESSSSKLVAVSFLVLFMPESSLVSP